VLVATIAAWSWNTGAADPGNAALERRFTSTVQPFLNAYCVACHGPEKQEAKLDLSGYVDAAVVVQDLSRFEIVLERLTAKEMPPEEAPRHPSADERQAVVEWIRALRKQEAERNAGDPGPVLPRRLSNAEYDYTIRDLTGVDIRPTREFPVDPANEAGFDNSGESLSMSPALLQKYLAAAQLVADHLVLKPTGFVFAPHPVVTDTDRDKYCVQRIIAFYQRQPTDYADYFFAAWRYRQRGDSDHPRATLDEIAAEQMVSAKYLATIWSLLTEESHDGEPLATLRNMWRELPDGEQADAARRGCAAMREYVQMERRKLTAPNPKVEVKGLSNSSQPIILWKDRQLAAQRLLPGGELANQTRTVKRFCAVFPDRFFVSERGRMFLAEDEQEKGRLLSAGFHLMVGYFRDDGPLYELVLDEQQQGELDALWRELDFVARVPIRQYKDFVFFERAEPPRFMRGVEFDFARSEDKDVISPAKIQRLRQVYLDKVRTLAPGDAALTAVEDYFDEMSVRIQWVEQTHREAQASHLEALLAFAERAYRRPLAAGESDDLLTFYRELREEGGLSHEDALRDCIVSLLMSPHFAYRIDLPASEAPAEPLSDYALASRLSYFLWASMPDQELLEHAAAGDLHQPEMLRAQTRRMLQDPRVRGLAVEFGGNWLDFRRFEQFQSVDRTRFNTFTDELRQAMFEEPIRFFLDVVQQDRSVLDFLNADHTFVNTVLADHYGMPLPAGGPDAWVCVAEATRYGRGGILPMAVFLTGNSHPLRTSPVKRGYWVVRRVLGERIPPPPPQVPELPRDEAALGDLTLPQLLVRHREVRSCAACHDRFDALGLVFESYGPIGERREVDLGGRPVNAQATFPDGSAGDGVPALRRYLLEQRQADYLDNFCRKLLAYALSRSLQLSDDNTVEQMRRTLAENDLRIGPLLDFIVTTPQFLNHRGRQGGAED